MSEMLDAEQAAIVAGTAEACGRVCDETCHGPLTCLRVVHPQNADVVTPHLAYEGGQLIQWVHP